MKSQDNNKNLFNKNDDSDRRGPREKREATTPPMTDDSFIQDNSRTVLNSLYCCLQPIKNGLFDHDDDSEGN